MDLFQGTEAAEWARKCYADELARAERARTHNMSWDGAHSVGGAPRLVRNPVFATVAVVMLMAILALAAA